MTILLFFKLTNIILVFLSNLPEHYLYYNTNIITKTVEKMKRTSV